MHYLTQSEREEGSMQWKVGRAYRRVWALRCVCTLPVKGLCTLAGLNQACKASHHRGRQRCCVQTGLIHGSVLMVVLHVWLRRAGPNLQVCSRGESCEGAARISTFNPSLNRTSGPP